MILCKDIFTEKAIGSLVHCNVVDDIVGLIILADSHKFVIEWVKGKATTSTKYSRKDSLTWLNFSVLIKA